MQNKRSKIQTHLFLSCIALLAVSPLSMAVSLLEAEEVYKRGEFSRAAELYLEVDDALVKATIGASRSYALTGDYESAEKVCRDALKKSNNSPIIQTQLAEVLFEVGRSDESLEILEKVVDSTSVGLRALVKYGEILNYRGRDGGDIYFMAAMADYSGRINVNSEEASLAARAQWLSGNHQEANRLFREATRLDRTNMEAQVWWGDLFAEKFNDAEAQQSYQQVLEYNPNYVPAIVGLARVTHQKNILDKALFTNPNSVHVFAAFAELALAQSKIGEARSYLNAALPNNAESLEIITPLAGIAALQENQELYEAFREQAEVIRPNSAEFYSKIADYFGKDYRFTEAVGFARKAIELEPEYWPAHTVLGSNLIRLGEEEEGRAVLELAFDKDPLNVQTSNMLKVFDTLDSYVTKNSEHFTVKMSQTDSQVFWPYLEPFLEDAWDTMEKKYGFTPEVPVLIEVFERREDFSVRSVGLPDIGPLVGICFGKVITLISPSTLTANWQEIVWHEFVHVVTLQMTKNRIPRWLSEGISVYEEHQGRDEWGQRQDLDVARAINQGKVLPIERIDDAFFQARSNDDLNLAYLQSYLVVEYIVDEFKMGGLKRLIEAYASHATTEENIRAVFGESAKEFNQGFSSWIEQRMAEVDVYVHIEDTADEGEAHGHGVRNNSSSVLAELYSADSVKNHMRDRIKKEPRDFQANLQLGVVLFKEKEYGEAKRYLNNAKQILPEYTGYPSPPLVLAQVYEATGELEKQIEELEYVVKFHQHDVNSALTLAEYAIKNEHFEKAQYYLQRAMAVDPYNLEAHRNSALLAEKLEMHQDGIREYEILAVLDNTDPVSAYTNLAGAYLRGGQESDAKHTSLKALEIAPTYKPAQKILLEAVGE